MAWLTGWNRRKSKTINGTTISQTNYQMRLTIHKGTGTDTATDIYLTNVRDDFGDIRFTKSDSTLLNYWIESYISANSAIFWIQIDSIPVSPSTTTIYIYYDNPSQVTTGNGFNTFIFFDHFDDYTPGVNDITEKGRWTKSGSPTITITGSIAIIDTTADNSYGIESVSSFGPDTAMNLRLQDYRINFDPSSFGYGRFSMPWPSSSTNTLSQQAYGSPNIAMFTAEKIGLLGSYVEIGDNGTLIWQKWKILYNTTTSRIYLDDVEKGNLSVDLPSDPMKATIGISPELFPSKIDLDYIFLCKQVDPEPTWGILGSEELVITAYSMYLSSNVCAGPCSITATVRWQNLGSSDLTFRPAILIDGTTLVYADPPDITIPGGSISSPSSITTPTPLSIGTHTICPYPN